MKARELRVHLAHMHDIPTHGLTWDHMTALHDYDHRDSKQQTHEHPDGGDG